MGVECRRPARIPALLGACAALALSSCDPAYATEIRIPALAGGKASVQLVDATSHRPVLGFDGPEWATAYEALDLSAPVTVELTPTAAIALAGGGTTCYLVSVVSGGGGVRPLLRGAPGVHRRSGAGHRGRC